MKHLERYVLTLLVGVFAGMMLGLFLTLIFIGRGMIP